MRSLFPMFALALAVAQPSYAQMPPVCDLTQFVPGTWKGQRGTLKIQSINGASVTGRVNQFDMTDNWKAKGVAETHYRNGVLHMVFGPGTTFDLTCSSGGKLLTGERHAPFGQSDQGFTPLVFKRQ